jgi:hypothetical protein
MESMLFELAFSWTVYGHHDSAAARERSSQRSSRRFMGTGQKVARSNRSNIPSNKHALCECFSGQIYEKVSAVPAVPRCQSNTRERVRPDAMRPMLPGKELSRRYLGNPPNRNG